MSVTNQLTNQISVPEFYEGKTVFITGGTGFIGKVLIEKLLRSCSGIRNIYVLIRPKKNKTVEERLRGITDLVLFDKVRNEQPNVLEKLKLVSGDVTELGLGLNPQDRQTLIDQVNIIFHCAASVRFDDSLRTAVIVNVRSTRDIVNLALEIKNLTCFLHVSTTYCQADKQTVDEKLYPPIADWQETIKIVEQADEHTLNILTIKYLDALPNTYTFAKNLAETVVYDLCQGKIPAIIMRPSIVISSALEPFYGWIDNFNGPVALLVASGKGVLRSVYTNPNIVPDYIPVDVIAKVCILAVWHKFNKNEPATFLDIDVYNGSNNRIVPVTMKKMIDMGKSFCSKYPLNDILWYPDGGVTLCWYYHYFRVIFYHLLPAFFIDGLLKLIGNRPRLLKIHQKIYSANMALNYFLSNEWIFHNDKTKNLQDLLTINDYDSFYYGDKLIDPHKYFERATRGCRRYLLNEDDSTLKKARIHTQRMWFLSMIFTILWYSVIYWLIFIKFDILTVIQQKYYETITYLTDN